MYEDIIRILYQLVNKKPITNEEKKLLEQWVSESEHNRKLYEEALDADTFRQEVKSSLDYDSKVLWKKVKGKLPKKNNTFSVFRNPLLRYAAAALLILGAGGYFFFFNRSSKEIISAGKIEKQKNDLPPGTDKALLTIANGSTIALDNSRTGIIVNQGGTTVTNQGAQLEYNATGAKPVDEVVSYHTLSTPRGGQYQLLLPDGSKVFLNAASSIRFPTSFAGKERIVEITGEAYFEVKHNASMPFKVKINAGEGGDVEVLGTNFNVNAYADEAIINTTLIEGSVKFSKNSAVVVLKPGEQVQLINRGQLKLIEHADVDAVMAWKNGMFSFHASNIKTVMQQITRWYDVEVEYAGEVKETFFVKMSRNTNVSNVFKILETTGGVHFDINGRKIIVKP